MRRLFHMRLEELSMVDRVLRPLFTKTPAALPEHIAIIMDGNGRWANQRHLPRVAGHKAGLEAARVIIRACSERGIKALTLFAFSSENWQRPAQEVQALMQLFITALRSEVNKLHKNNVQLRVIGNMSRLNTDLQEAIRAAEAKTANNTGLILVVAVDYGGQWDITQAAQHLSELVLNGKLRPEEITVERFQQALSTKDLPPADLLIRTSGEQRISNFLLWQLSYAELYFTETYWPDFDLHALDVALQFFAERERRFGHATDKIVDRVERVDRVVDDIAHA
jgi:undecaprenyl diphosphate synthase